MKISKILKRFPEIKIKGNIQKDFDLKWVTENSKLIPDEPFMFIAKRGIRTDGWKFVPNILKKGCKCVLSDHIPDYNIDIPTLLVKNISSFLPDFLEFFYNSLEKNITLIGITGTNGKTTTTYILEALFEKSSRMGTTNINIQEEIFPTANTTPDISTIYYYIKKAINKGSKYFIMEVTSHAIALNRLGNLEFDVLIFTNIGHDHLDFHENFENYKNTKYSFFKKSETYKIKKPLIITNIDDELGILIKKLKNTKSVSLNNINADFNIKIKKLFIDKSIFEINNQKYIINLPGIFNVYNATLAISCALLLGIKRDEILNKIIKLKKVDGRMHHFLKDGKHIFIDFAHTPDSLKNVLKTLNHIKTGKLFIVFGCGGNRDRLKRSKMGKIAAELADFVILTDDNPRDEDPLAIIEDIKSGFPETFRAFIVKTPRKNAIKYAFSFLNKSDILLIAGKGHEKTQEIKGKFIPYSDFEVIESL